MKSDRHASLRWILVPPAAKLSVGGTAMLNPEHLKHLRKVLRMEWDEEARVTDGHGRLFEARLKKLGDAGGVDLIELLRQEPKPRDVELVICLPKNATMDWVVEKAVECGVTRITPVISSRSVVKADPKEAEKYVRRWQTIMDGAIEQSEQCWRPTVSAPQSWAQWLSGAKTGAPSIAFVSELRRDIETDQTEREALRRSWAAMSQAASQGVRILIGPEGGLSEQERSDLVDAGFSEQSLGSVVLRVETAVIAALSLLRVSHLVSAS